jgi:hypothetical protein
LLKKKNIKNIKNYFAQNGLKKLSPQRKLPQKKSEDPETWLFTAWLSDCGQSISLGITTSFHFWAALLRFFAPKS